MNHSTLRKVFFQLTNKLCLVTILLLTSINSFSQDIPKVPSPQRLVNDFVGILSGSEIEELERKLVAFDDTTSNQISVVVVNTVEPYDMNSFAVKLGREWGIGNEGKNNGIIVLWATGDRKVYIATGYGLEGALPDAYAKRIVDRIIIPYFKNSQFYEGLSKGTDAIMHYTSGEYEAESDESGEFPLWGFILMVIVIYIVIRSMSKGGGQGPGGGIGGGNSSWPYHTYTGWGRHSGNWSGGGGGWSGGGGGGFGGFGGGSFGGGGAGGSY